MIVFTDRRDGRQVVLYDGVLVALTEDLLPRGYRLGGGAEGTLIMTSATERAWRAFDLERGEATRGAIPEPSMGSRPMVDAEVFGTEVILTVSDASNEDRYVWTGRGWRQRPAAFPHFSVARGAPLAGGAVAFWLSEPGFLSGPALWRDGELVVDPAVCEGVVGGSRDTVRVFSDGERAFVAGAFQYWEIKPP
jgi:hypothetical protein